MNEAEIKELKIAKYKCLTSTLFFTRYFFKKRFDRKFEVDDHHEQIGSALDRVIKGEIKKLIINIAPRYGKTELAVKNFIARGLAVNPAARFIHLSYSDDLALDNSEEVKNIVKDESYQQLFPGVKITQNSDSKKKWYTTAGGGVYATSTAGQVTGFGAGKVDDSEAVDAVFGGALIIDDPIKPEDADSDVVRDRINQRFDSTIRNRVNSRNTPIIIIMQRLHEKDLCGYLMEQEPDAWEVLSLPCIVNEGKDDERALWPKKHSLDELYNIKSLNDIVFERQYMQHPMPLTGIMFPDGELRRFKPDKLRKYDSSLAYADIADEGSDSLSCPIGRNIGTDIYITDVVFNTDMSDITIPLVADAINRNECSYVRVESNSMGAMYARNLQKELLSCKVLTAVSTTNKHTRILMDAAFIVRHCLFLEPEYQSKEYKAFMKELSSYMKVGGSKHDDAPDSLSGLVIFVRAMLRIY